MAMGLGQLAAPMLLTGAMAYFTADAAPGVSGAASVVAAIFGPLAILMLAASRALRKRRIRCRRR